MAGKATDHEKIRNDLMDGVIRAGAKYGLAGITNQAIAGFSGQSEPYIYRYFFDREDLIKKAFLRSDTHLFGVMAENVRIAESRGGTKRENFNHFMNLSWDYMVEDYDYCRFYIRYYYSEMNTLEVMKEHWYVCRDALDQVQGLFEDLRSLDDVMHQWFTTVLAGVMDMATGRLADSAENREKLFDVLYTILSPILKEEER